MIHRAIEFATRAHRGQVRKGTRLPYIVHPVETAMILAQAGAKEELICAGLLHDTLEDTKVTKEELVENFGIYVTRLVIDRSENKQRSWEERKRHTIDHVKRLGWDGKLLLCADKLSNIRSVFYDYQKLGEELWKRFRRGREAQKWYYGEIIKALEELEGLAMYQELKQIYIQVFEQII